MIPIYVNDIMCSLENKCYFPALALALTLPDICGMAEFPNKSVGKRYIEWYDKYLGDCITQDKDDLSRKDPWLSGEIIYNLRNSYLHQGNPGIVSNKVKEEANQLDKFILVLGDGTGMSMSTLNMGAGTQETGQITYRLIMVDVTYLCLNICNCALWYYENNQEKFKFDFNVITQEELIHPSAEALQFVQADLVAKSLNHKLEKEGNTMRLAEDPAHRSLAVIGQLLNSVLPLDCGEKSKVDERENCKKKTESKKENTDTKNEPKKKQSSKNVSKEKREAQVRSFFGRYFKEKIYLDKKEEIIQVVLGSKTRLQVNNNLMKHFTSKEAGLIYQRLGPLLKDLPGK